MAIDLEIPNKAAQRVYPLTSMQQNMLSHSQFMRQPGLDIEQVIADLREALDVRAFERAWKQVFLRHAVLRTGFRWQDASKPQQEVHEGLDLDFSYEDWTDVSCTEQKRKFEEWLTKDRERGFNPGRPPLMRLALIRLRTAHHRLVWTFHHLLLDATAFTIVLQEAFAFYEATHEGYELGLSAPVSFCDYIKWLEQQDFVSHQSFWRETLKGFEAPTPLVIARSSGRVFGEGKATHGEQEIRLSEEETTALKSVAQTLGVTLSTMVEAAWGLLLGRYSGQEDVLFGGVRACRSSSFPCAKSVVGLLINTVPVRVRIDPQAQAGQWLQMFRRDQIALRSHEQTPLLNILECLENRQAGQLFETILNYQNTAWHDDLSAQGEEWRNRTFFIRNQPNYPLWADCYGGRQLVLKAGYERSRLEGDTIQRMLQHFKNLLCGMAANPAVRVGELKLLGQDERKSVLVEWNQTDVDYPKTKCIHEVFEEQAARTPEALAIECGANQLTYRELNRRANQLAHHLQKSGVGAETIVGVCIERSTELVVSMLAILKAGGAYLPMDPSYPKERLCFMLRDAEARILLTRERFRADAELPELKCLFVDSPEYSANNLESDRTENPERATSASNLAYVIYTSGSTGRPKGVAIEHRSLMNLVTWHQRAYEITADDRATQVASPAFDAAVWEIWPYLAIGASVHVPQEEIRLYPARLIRWMQEQQITLSFLPTPLAEAMMQEPWPKGIKLRALLTGGEKLQRPAPKGFGCWLTNHYGPTESTVVTSAAVVEPGSDPIAPPPIGCPIANTRVYLLDRYGEPVPIGVPGEIHISGVGLARGYLNQPELTAEKFILNPFANGDPDHNRLYKTGDLARYLPDGNLEFIGRIDQQVKIRGHRVEIGEIDAVLGQHPEVGKVVVLAERGALNGYIIPASGCKPSAKELRGFLAERLPEYMIPSAFVLLEAMPLTANGKVDRRALASLDTGSEAIIVGGRTPAEREIAEVWGQVLGREVSRDDNFFEIGGHSLQATRVLTRLQDRFQLNLSLQLLFEAPTVAQLAERIEADKSSGAKRDEQRKENLGAARNGDGKLPLSFAQERIWFFEQMEPGLPLHNVPVAMEVRGALDINGLERSLNEVVRRHGVLRTSFLVANGRPVAREDPASRVVVQKVDLTHLPEEERRAEAQRLAEEEAKRPFDLSASPLLRVRVLELGRDDHWLLITTHHIVSDGWSMGTFYRELGKLYGAFSQAGLAALPRLAIGYGEYVRWQRERMAGALLDQQLDYWKKQLSGAPPILDLPTDRPRSARQTYGGGMRSFALSAQTTSGLKQLAREKDVTLFMVLLAGIQTLLYRYSGQEEILIGSPIAGRMRPDTEGLIGLFLNTQVLRGNMSGDPSVDELLRRVRTMALEAYSHQELPFEKLVEALHPQRDLSRSPLFQVMFVLQNAPFDALAMSGLRLRPIPVHSGTSKFDLTVSVEENSGGLSGYVEFNSDLFDPETITRLIGHYETILMAMAADSEAKVSSLPLLTEAERRQLLVEWTNTRTEFQTEKCIHTFFEEQALRSPKAVAVVCGEKQLTYEALNESADALASSLRAMGAGPEIRVAICVSRSIEMMVGLLGILKAGACYVPLDPSYPRERLAFMLEDSQAAVLVTEERLRTHLEVDGEPQSGLWLAAGRSINGNSLQLLRLRGLEKGEGTGQDRQGAVPPVSSSNLAYVIYTSGSTGKPKGVMVTHRNAANFFAGMDQLLGTTSGVWLAVTSISFDISVLELFWTLGRGFKVIIQSDQGGSAESIGFDIEKANGHRSSVPEQIIRHNVTHLQCTPSLAGTLVLAPESVQAMRSLSNLLLGGEALPFSLVQKVRPLVGGEIFNMYGPTETTVWSSAERVENCGGPVTIGKPIANTQIYILDRQLQPVAIGIPGEIYIGGDGVARGYLNRAELTAEKFIANPFSADPGARLYRTGDLGRYRADGKIEFLGRADQQIKLRGHRIELGEIEAVLRRHPAVKEAAVQVWENGVEDKRLAAYIVSGAGAAPGSEELRRFVQQQLPPAMIPGVFVPLKQLPLTPNGKIDRKALPEPWVDRSILETVYLAPGTETEKKIARVWQELLGIEHVGLEDNFFDLGGHSLLVVRAQASLRMALGMDLPVVKLFQYPTVRSLAAFLSEQVEQPRSVDGRGYRKQAAYARRARREQEVAS